MTSICLQCLPSFIRVASLEDFFSRKVSKNLGSIPFVGLIIGISRIAFANYQYTRSAPDWTEARWLEERKRGRFEILGLGLVLLIQEAYFARASSIGEPFTLLRSEHFADHAQRLVSWYQTKRPDPNLLRSYQDYRSSGQHAWQNQPIFQGADFFTRHGVMHACFVAMFIPIFISLYRAARHPEAAHLTLEDIQALQAVAFLHDYGRVHTNSDLCRDREELERLGQQAAYRYLKEGLGLSEEKARRFSELILTKDHPLPGKSLIQQLLQNSDCLAVLRADDWQFNPRFLDFLQWNRTSTAHDAVRRHLLEQELFGVIDAAKRLLVQLGDSPYNMTCFSESLRGQVIRGQFSLATKRSYEQHPQCYTIMRQLMQNDPILQRYNV
jgi:hypothetical protein